MTDKLNKTEREKSRLILIQLNMNSVTKTLKVNMIVRLRKMRRIRQTEHITVFFNIDLTDDRYMSDRFYLN